MCDKKRARMDFCVLLPIDFFSTFEALFCSLGCGIFFL